MILREPGFATFPLCAKLVKEIILPDKTKMNFKVNDVFMNGCH